MLKYEDSENIKADRVSTVVFNLHQIKRRAFFLGHPVVITFVALKKLLLWQQRLSSLILLIDLQKFCRKISLDLKNLFSSQETSVITPKLFKFLSFCP